VLLSTSQLQFSGIVQKLDRIVIDINGRAVLFGGRQQAIRQVPPGLTE
jgi:hypothetical protein